MKYESKEAFEHNNSRDTERYNVYTPCSLSTELRANKINYCNKIIY